MNQKSLTTRGLRQVLLVTSLAAGLGLSAGTVLAGDGINPHADEILRAMSDHLGKTRSFTVEADISNEIVNVDGQKLQLNSYATVALDRPTGFKITRRGKFADVALYYDGTQMSLFGKELNAYMQKPLAGTIDDALRDFERNSGLALPGADLLLANPYAALTGDATSSGYYGKAYVGGVETHHLAFRTPKVDVQVWVDAGEKPLPMKYVITTKWITGAPQYSVQLRNWNTQPKMSAEQFRFSPPKGALKIDTLPVDDAGEITLPQEKK